jgi:dihydroflavonol-4-reductase
MTEVAAIIEGITGVAAPRFVCPGWLALFFAPLVGLWARVIGEAPIYTRDSLAALSTNKVMSHAKAARELAYEPRPFQHSMRDALDFYSRQYNGVMPGRKE